MKKIRVLELFAGIGAVSKALKNIGFDVEIVDAVEIDKYAIASFNGVHNTNFEPQDICEWNKNIEVDLIAHGSPCTDYSIAGKQAGGDEGSGTRSSLMYESIRIIKNIKPKYILWENVKNVLAERHIHNFNNYISRLDELGYNSYYKVLNAKNYGIPQNRERIYTISIRKDIDTGFEFPEPKELKLKLKDLLEEKVDEKYYLSDKFLAGLIKHNEHHKEKGTGFIWKPRDLDGVASTLRANAALAPTDNTIQIIGDLDIKGHDQVKRIYSGEGLAPTLTNMQGGNRQPKVLIDEPVIAASRGRNPENPSDRTPGIYTEQRLEINKQGISNTITTVQKDNYVLEPLKIKEATKLGYKEAYAGDGINISGRMKYQRGNVQKDMCQTLVTSGSERGVVTENMRIRKLTPLECWRLMSFDDEDFYKAKEALNNKFYKGKDKSSSQLYKQARKFNSCKSFRSYI